MRVEEMVALELEGCDYVVIRAFAAGCPDLIAIAKEHAHLLRAIEVKGPGDMPRPAQREVIKKLESQGVQAEFKYTRVDFQQDKEERMNWWLRLPKWARIEPAKMWLSQGWKARQYGVKRELFPRDGEPGSSLYIQHRAEWLYGWDKANEEMQRDAVRFGGESK